MQISPNGAPDWLGGYKLMGALKRTFATCTTSFLTRHAVSLEKVAVESMKCANLEVTGRVSSLLTEPLKVYSGQHACTHTYMDRFAPGWDQRKSV